MITGSYPYMISATVSTAQLVGLDIDELSHTRDWVPSAQFNATNAGLRASS
jgi:hypothetical protein